MFIFQRRVHVYETDLMGIVHHSNYVRYCEEARVQFLTNHQMIKTSQSEVYSLAVVDIRFKYLKPLRYGDLFFIEIQIRTEGVRVFLQYRLRNEKNEICILAETVHCSLSQDLKSKEFKVTRLDSKLVEHVNKYNLKTTNRTDQLKENPWTEIWL